MKNWVAEGRSDLYIATKLGISLQHVKGTVRELYPGRSPKTKKSPAPKGRGSRSNHGDPGKYNAGCRCTICKAGNTERATVARDERRGRIKDAPHGTESGYRNWGCRCKPCKKEGSRMNFERTYLDPALTPRNGERWVGPEESAITDYGHTARTHALKLGRTISGVNGKRSQRNRSLRMSGRSVTV